MNPSEKNAAELPRLPRLTLRLGLAGNRAIDPAVTGLLAERLDAILAVIAGQLVGAAANRGASVTRFYSDGEKPLLRLVTGLAEGADALGADALDRLVGHAAYSSRVDTELAAVLPFEFGAYRDSRDAAFRPAFDRHAARCAYILELDGLHDKPTADSAPTEECRRLAARRRRRGYRAQAAFLLRHADLMVVVADPSADGRPGGALETLRGALAFGLPVVFVDAAWAAVRLIAPEEDPAAALDADRADEAGTADWQPGLARLVDQIIAGPETGERGEVASAACPSDRLALLEDYFEHPWIPPMIRAVEGGFQRKPSWRERLWSHMEAWLYRASKAGPRPRPDPKIAAYVQWRRRATDLNYDAAGLYRGAFLANYLLAVIAVCLAAVSLALIGYAPGAAHLEQIQWVLLGMAVAKLAVLGTIFHNTHQAQHAKWNERAIDCRYLAERLRALYYLPKAGSFQPPYVAPPEYASRVLRQSVVDWLADAITRAVSPAEALAAPADAPHSPGAGPGSVRILRVDPLAVAGTLRDDWVGGQIAYHRRNARGMEHLHGRVLDRWVGRLSLGVIAIVLLDMGLLGWEILVHHPGEASAAALHYVAVALLLFAAVLPATVASLNGVRFQSECRRLAERSGMMRDRLEGRQRELERLADRIARARRDPETDPGAWSADLLRLTEAVARDLIQEVGEWSVLYTREVPDPG